MHLRRSELLILGLILFAFCVGIYFYPQMPDSMASHWNAKGQVDVHMPKFWGLFLMPIIILGMALLFIAIPRSDSLKTSIEQFRTQYDGFIVVDTIFMLVIHFQMLLWNIGIKIRPNVPFPIGVGLLYIYLSILLEHAKRSSVVAIKTPWTLSSEKVWETTHRIGAILLKIAGAIAFFGAVFQNYVMWLVLSPGLLVVAYTTVYSFVKRRKEMKQLV